MDSSYQTASTSETQTYRNDPLLMKWKEEEESKKWRMLAATVALTIFSTVTAGLANTTRGKAIWGTAAGVFGSFTALSICYLWGKAHYANQDAISSETRTRSFGRRIWSCVDKCCAPVQKVTTCAGRYCWATCYAAGSIVFGVAAGLEKDSNAAKITAAIASGLLGILALGSVCCVRANRQFIRDHENFLKEEEERANRT